MTGLVDRNGNGNGGLSEVRGCLIVALGTCRKPDCRFGDLSEARRSSRLPTSGKRDKRPGRNFRQVLRTTRRPWDSPGCATKSQGGRSRTGFSLQNDGVGALLTAPTPQFCSRWPSGQRPPCGFVARTSRETHGTAAPPRRLTPRGARPLQRAGASACRLARPARR